MNGTIFNIQRFCIHDGDGIRTSVFFKGCPLRCIWCHNPEGLEVRRSLLFKRSKCTLCKKCLDFCPSRTITDGKIVIDREKCRLCGKCVAECPAGAFEIAGREVTAEEIVSEAAKDKLFYETSGGGLTLSGGEPSMQAEFATEIITLAKKEGISVSIETCGIGSRQFYESAAEMGCTFLYDLKCMDSEKHARLTGVPNERILSNLDFLFSVGADVILRLPMIPGVNDSDEDIALLADHLRKNAGKYRYAEIMPYHTLGIEKARRLDKSDVLVREAAGEPDRSRWMAEFASHGVEIRVSE